MQSDDKTSYPELLAAAELEIAAIEAICEMLEQTRTSQSELARRLQVSPPYITHLMRGRKTVSLRQLAQIAHLLGYRIDFTIHKLDQ